MAIRVINPGALTTVQDIGRTGYQELGMPCSGVMDTCAYQAANTLVGNKHGEAVLEFTLFGGIYQIEEDAILALTGADMAPLLDGAACPMNRPFPVRRGQILMVGTALSGCRSYLAVSGGIDVPTVLGSRSTNLKCAIGGFEGRALKVGDLLPVGVSSIIYREVADRFAPERIFPEMLTVRAIGGPQEDLFTEQGRKTFYTGTYTVSQESDRMGCRLRGAAIESRHGTDIVSDAIVFGSIQVTPAGQPIILLADRQTTGGYAKIATVCTADLPALAQARPGYTIHFQKITVEEAQKLLQ
ncbi:MAG: biotin-dependent carboxyltransferase family protein [Lachnospiraceae bacterium]|nr:biotin-dependent carboxyltransferase family protein [Lachnospiraceae bacterium]